MNISGPKDWSLQCHERLDDLITIRMSRLCPLLVLAKFFFLHSGGPVGKTVKTNIFFCLVRPLCIGIMTFFETRKFIEKQNSTLEFQFESLLSDFSRIKGNIKSLTV